ncbi:LPS assembly protein LptD [Desulfovibrio sp. OttesenSCG-928-G11]|nr:LPS assembly protein LptD [Desulfovibrio sp. OttesenSCG-928-G11]
METEDEVLVRWDLTADEIVTMNDEEILEAKGNVLLRRGNETLRADFARYYMSTKWVFLKGNVKVNSGQDTLDAEEAEFDLRSRVGWLKQGRIFMAGPHTYLAGERIDKHWGDVYSFKQAKVTACDGDVPAWSFTAEEAVVEIDGYARLSKAAFQVKDVPSLYTPFFIMPVKTKRQTGFLAPEFGRSTSKGVYYNQPFFWAVNENSDVTLNEYFMEKRGFMHGVEYRAMPSEDSTGWIRADWMYDKKRKMHEDSGDYSGDGLRRTNYERWWLRGMFDSRFDESGWRLKADLDLASDRYFLSEFDSDFSGFERSRDELFDLFRRDLQEKDLKRQSGFLLNHDWQRGSVALSAMYYQDPTLGNGNRSRDMDDTVQHLPQFDAFLYKGRIIEALPLEIDASAQAAYMYRRHGTRGARYEVVPRLTMPLNSRYGSIIASGGIYQTLYDTELPARDRDDRDNMPRQNKDTRTVPEFGAAAFTEFARVFSFDAAPLETSKEGLGTSRWLALRHSIQPRVEYAYRVNEDQDRNPHYTGDDRLLPGNELVYSITNVLSTKRERVVMVKDEATGEMVPGTMTEYKELLSLRVEHSHDFREASRSERRDEFPRRPSGDIFSDLSWFVTDNFSLSTRNNWSPYEGELVRHQAGGNLKVFELGSIYAGYDMRRSLQEYNREWDDKVRYLRFDVETANFWDFSLRASVRADYENTDNRETDFDLVYNHQCFKLIGRVSVDPQDENYQLYVVLSGLGD